MDFPSENDRECFYGSGGMIRRPGKYLVFFDGFVYYRHYYKTRENGPDSISALGDRTWPKNNVARNLIIGPTRNLP